MIPLTSLPIVRAAWMKFTPKTPRASCCNCAVASSMRTCIITTLGSCLCVHHHINRDTRLLGDLAIGIARTLMKWSESGYPTRTSKQHNGFLRVGVWHMVCRRVTKRKKEKTAAPRAFLARPASETHHFFTAKSSEVDFEKGCNSVQVQIPSKPDQGKSY
jgi:hypothetical protein